MQYFFLRLFIFAFRKSVYPSCDYPENPARSQDSSRYQGYPVSQNPLEPNEITKVVSYFNRQVQDFDTYKLFICVQDPNSDRPVAVRTPSLLSPSDVLFILDNPDLFLVGTDITGTVSDSYYATEPRTIVVDHPSSKRRLDLSRLDEKGDLQLLCLNIRSLHAMICLMYLFKDIMDLKRDRAKLCRLRMSESAAC